VIVQGGLHLIIDQIWVVLPCVKQDLGQPLIQLVDLGQDESIHHDCKINFSSGGQTKLGAGLGKAEIEKDDYVKSYLILYFCVKAERLNIADYEAVEFVAANLGVYHRACDVHHVFFTHLLRVHQRN